jgi:hypothetical protein
MIRIRTMMEHQFLYRCFLGIIVNYHPFYGRFDILPGIQVDNFYIKGGSFFAFIFLNEGEIT